MKIKILEVYEHQFTDDNCYNNLYTVNETTDWDEVTDEEFQILLKWACEHNMAYNRSTRYVILTEKHISIPRTVKAFVERAARVQREKEETQRKKEEQEAKRQKTVRQRKEAKERKLLEDLKSKYEKG